MAEHMFEQTLTLLLAGEFVCAVRYPDACRFLEDEAQRRDAEAFLARLGRRLASTRQPGSPPMLGSARTSGAHCATGSPRSSTICACW